MALEDCKNRLPDSEQGGQRQTMVMAIRIAVPFLIWILGLGFVRAAPLPSWAHSFQMALRAEKAGHQAVYRREAKAVRKSIVYPYLQYYDLKDHLGRTSPAVMRHFLAHYSRLPISYDLRMRWLLWLAKHHRWAEFLSFYRASHDPRLICEHILAWQHTGLRKQAREEAQHLFLSGDRRPFICNDAFALLKRHGRWPEKMVWTRVIYSLEAGHDRLAEAMIRRLPPQRQKAAHLLLQIERQPKRMLKWMPDHFISREDVSRIATAALIRLSQAHPIQASRLWENLNPSWHRVLTRHDRERIERTMALFAAVDGLSQGVSWLSDLPNRVRDAASREWLVRAALRVKRWHIVVNTIEKMPRWQARKPIWRYWLGRALIAIGKTSRGRRVLKMLANRFDYYGFLAADALALPYAHGPQPPPENRHLQARVAHLYLTKLAFALHVVGLNRDAGQIWRLMLSELVPKALIAAARLAQERHWPFAAFAAAQRSAHDGASVLTFPLADHHLVTAAAHRSQLPASVILAVMRQESAYQSTVCSSAGACGLLQLLPSTACWIGRKAHLGSALCQFSRLSEPALNILAGSVYLSYLMNHFTHNLIAAIAAYNAGPDNVNVWLQNRSRTESPLVWIETIPFVETRHYIKAVLFNQVVYADLIRHQQPQVRLTSLVIRSVHYDHLTNSTSSETTRPSSVTVQHNMKNKNQSPVKAVVKHGHPK